MSGNNVTVRNKIDVNKKDKHGMSSLVVAINSGRSDIAKILISEHNADVNTRFGKNSDTALHLACHRASSKKLNSEKQLETDKMVKLLLDHGADPNTLNKNLQTPVAFTTGRQKEEFFLDTCLSECITYEAFCDSVRGVTNLENNDKNKRLGRRQELSLSYA